MRHISIRDKAVIASFLIPLFIFLLIGPWGRAIKYYALPPSSPKNINIVVKSSEIDISFDESKEFDFAKYKLKLYQNDLLVKEVETKQTQNLVTGLETGVEYSMEVVSIDDLDRQSSAVQFEFSTNEGIQSRFLNRYDRADYLEFFVILTSGIIAFLITVASLWIVRLKQSVQTFTNIVLFPALIFIPILLFVTSVSFSINSMRNLFIFSASFSVAAGIVMYILFLTMNILHTAHYKQIPLEQAAKASQFLFILISTYILLIYTFGSDFNFYERTITIIPFILYYTYISTWALREVAFAQVIVRTLATTLVMVLAVTILSIWPVYYVYAMLASAVIFYILLSISLEIRERLNAYVWVEYSLLIVVVILLLFSTASWGINGTII